MHENICGAQIFVSNSIKKHPQGYYLLGNNREPETWVKHGRMAGLRLPRHLAVQL